MAFLLGALGNSSQRLPGTSIIAAASTPGFTFTVKRRSEDGSSNDLKVSVRIVEALTAKDHKKDKLHVNYIIDVDTGIPGMSWRVARRYRTFSELDKQLRLIFENKIKLPALPKKHLIRSFKPEVIEQKRQELERYLSELAQHPEVTSSDLWSSFFIGTFEDLFERTALQQSQQEQLERLTKELAQHKALLAELQATVKRLEQENERMASSVREKQAAEAQSERLETQLRAEQEESRKLREEVAALRQQLEQTEKQAKEKLAEAEAALSLANEEKIKALEAAVVAQNEAKTLKAQKKLLVKEVKSQRQQFESYLNALASQGIALPPMQALLDSQQQQQQATAPGAAGSAPPSPNSTLRDPLSPAPAPASDTPSQS